MTTATAPARASCLPLGAGTIDLWRIDLDGLGGLDGGRPSLDERERAARFAFARDRTRYLRGRRALRLVLAAYEGREPEALDLVSGPHGKPALRGGRHSFNATHAGGEAIVAIADGRAVGVDLEHRRPCADAAAIARGTFAADEARVLAALADPARTDAFFRAWTRKEAALKAIGTGLVAEPARYATGLVRERQRVGGPDAAGLEVETFLDDGHGVASVAAFGGWSALRVRAFSPETLDP